jgi:hypothetical protein
MIIAVGLLAACTFGLGLAIEPVVRLSRDAATQLMGEGVRVLGATVPTR